MSNRRPFLTAQWLNLGLITYEVEPVLLRPHLPPGCELDTVDDRAFVSLVAFDFRDTRVLGIRWPGHVDFPEINLRFYVRFQGTRGVCFIRELVPKRLIAWLARGIYNEPYRPVPMHSRVVETAEGISIHHQVEIDGHHHNLEMTGSNPLWVPPEGSTEHFFKEHSYGFGRTRDGRLLSYEVRHPVWSIYRNPLIKLDWDFAAVYGKKWSILRDQQPVSLVLAAGSGVAVYPKGVISR